MKKLIEKATEYTDSVTPYSAYLSNLIRNAYIAGATEALASQWRVVEDELPKENEDVFVRYTNYVEVLECGAAYYDGEDWYTTDGEHIRPSHWMPIPELPKNDKE